MRQSLLWQVRTFVKRDNEREDNRHEDNRNVHKYIFDNQNISKKLGISKKVWMILTKVDGSDKNEQDKNVKKNNDDDDDDDDDDVVGNGKIAADDD